MALRTSIQWCDSTVNPGMGCDGCDLWSANAKSIRTCYAGMLHQRFAASNPGYAAKFLEPEKYPGRMAVAARWSDLRGKPRGDKPWLDGMPRAIFIGDMGDMFSPAFDFPYLKTEIIDNVLSENGRCHIWQVLTKRPARMSLFRLWLRNECGLEWPRNLWPMTSVTRGATLSRIDGLAEVGDGRVIRGVSFEPLLEAIDWDRALSQRRINWAIFGGESGRNARSCQLDWIREGIHACRRHEITPFVKQLGCQPVVGMRNQGGRPTHPYTIRDSHGGDWAEWPEYLRVREMPVPVPEPARR